MPDSIKDQLINSVFPQYCNVIEKSDSSEIVISHSKDGNPVPSVKIEDKMIALHSAFNPRREAERFINQIDFVSHNLFVVTGFAFAYHIEILMNSIQKDDCILVIEKDAAIVKEALLNRDLTDIISDKRLILLIDPTDDDITKALRGKSSRSSVFVTQRGSYRVYREYYENVIRMVKSYLSSKEVNIATLARFQKLWTLNCAKNSIRMAGSVPVKEFYGKFEGIDAVVVGAGPSLLDSIASLKRVSESVLVIAVDTSLRLCIENGISPHFVLCADPQLINARYFEQAATTSAVLIADPACHPSVFRLFKGLTSMCGMPFEMFAWVEEITGKMGEITHGGSVSTNAYDFARRLGVDNIYLIGQDLSFTQNLAHCRGSYLDEMMFNLHTRFFNQEMFNRRQLRALPPIAQPSVKGGIVYTNQKMMIFKQWFEKRMDERLFNASADGMNLQGIQCRQLSEIAQSKHDIRKTINDIYSENTVSAKEMERRFQLIKRRSEQIYNENDLLTGKLRTAVETTHKIIEMVETEKGNPSQYLKVLDDIDEYIGTLSSSKSIVGMSVQKTIHTIQEGYDLEENSDSSLSSSVKRSKFLYSGLLDGAIFTERVLRKIRHILAAG
jgi:hypothetical protein